MRSVEQLRPWPVHAMAVAAFVMPSLAFARVDPRVTVELDLADMPATSVQTLQVRLSHRTQAVLSEARFMPATQPEDLWVQAKIRQRVDEDGNQGFDLEFIGSQGGQERRWPEMSRRCTLCTDGEFVETYGEALTLLARFGIAQAIKTKTKSKSKSKLQAPLAASTSLRAKPKAVISPPAPDRLPPRKPAQPLRWWGWMGAGLAAAGGTSIVASLVTMPRDVPVAGDPTRIHPLRFDRSTTVGVVVGGSFLVAGVSMWLADRFAPRTRSKTKLTMIGPMKWSF